MTMRHPKGQRRLKNFAQRVSLRRHRNHVNMTKDIAAAKLIAVHASFVAQPSGVDPEAAPHYDDGGNRVWLNSSNERHRIGGPAVEWDNGDREWFLHDLRHRVDGPAVQRTDGTNEYWVHAMLHREDGPAVQKPDGYQAWYRFDKLHHVNGPAVIHADGRSEWWVDGAKVTKAEVLGRGRGAQESFLNSDERGNKFWRNSGGQLHRHGGPAVKLINGTQEWWVNGQRHHVTGPAVKTADGSREWWLHNQRHRCDGPAIERANGDRFWFIKGVAHRIDGPAVERANDYQAWWVDGKRHRTNGPAVVWADGTEEFWLFGHRVDRSDLVAAKRFAQLTKTQIAMRDVEMNDVPCVLVDSHDNVSVRVQPEEK